MRTRRTRRVARFGVLLGGTALLTAAGFGAASLLRGDLALVRQLHPGAADHLDQGELVALLQQGRDDEAFDLAFEHGDELFETGFNAVDGVGANVGDGLRFTRVPRADLGRAGEWAAHVPARTTGPNAAACNACHSVPGDDGAGGAQNNAVRDPFHTGDPRRMIQRNTPHLFGAGALQRLAEEMTAELQVQREQLLARVRSTGREQSAALAAKGVGFGTLRAAPRLFGGIAMDFRRVDGIDRDLVVRPYQWKGSVAFVRDFNRSAAHNELGMQAVELVGAAFDGDGDHVTDELSIGDMTALAVYIAAQPRPTTRTELAKLGIVPPLDPAVVQSIARGRQVFAAIGCAECHVPSLRIADPIVREPSRSADYRDGRFPGGQQPVAEGVSPALPVHFDLGADLPDNRIKVNGELVLLGAFARGSDGTEVVVELYGDLRRHDMGSELAENIDEAGSGRAVFLTENLWGVGTTAPYLHDGRATTLTEAILEHGGEAGASRQAFRTLPQASQLDLLAFLDDLVLFKAD